MKIPNIAPQGSYRKTILDTVTEYGVKKPLKAFANSKLIKADNDRCNKSQMYANGVGVMSIILKDAVSCYYYVTQSLNNKKIPEEKRKFVASLDLVNGVLMNITQLLAFFTISNKAMQSKMFNKFFGKYFERAAKKSMEVVMQSNPQGKFKDFTKIEDTKVYNAIKESCKGGFGYITGMVASTIIAKRMIVPFIATPLASWAKDKFMNDDKTKGKTSTPANKPAAEEQNKTPQAAQVMSFNDKNVEQMYKQLKHIS